MRQSRPQLELAEVFRVHEQAFARQYRGSISLEQWQVIRAIKHCRTEELGGHRTQCSDCGHQRIAYNSCRNRHCPKCQGSARARWVAAREQELLPVPYFHVVFTLPELLSPLALQNKQLVYSLLFATAAETLQQVAADPRHLGAKIGLLAILHTWGQNLSHHPHLHCVVPAGGISADGTRWIACRRGKRNKRSFFLPVRVLSRVFRGKFIAKLKQAFQLGQLDFHGALTTLAARQAFNDLLNRAVANEWVVYAKKPFGGPQQVLRYLARYTHRVAISNERLVRMEGDQVTFRWKDYRRGHHQQIMTLPACQFMRRFLMHTLPKGFTRIRHYGLLSNRNRQANLKRCRQLLAANIDADSKDTLPTIAPVETPSEIRCPGCQAGIMVIVEVLSQRRSSVVPSPHFSSQQPSLPPAWDTS